MELHRDLRVQSPRNISLVLNALCRADIRDTVLLDHIANVMGPSMLKSFNVQDLALVCNSYARLSRPAPKLFRASADELLWKLPDAGTQELAMVANAFAKVREYDASLFRHVQAWAVRWPSNFDVKHAATLLHSFARVEAPCERLFRHLAHLCTSDAAADLSPSGVAQMCFAVGNIVPRDPELVTVARPLLEILARRILSLGPDFFEPRHVVMVARGCHKVGAHSPRLVRVLTPGLLKMEEKSRVGGKSHSSLLDVVDAAATMRDSLDRASSVANSARSRQSAPDDCVPLDRVLLSALQSLAKNERALRHAALMEERRRLEAWDRSLTSWLGNAWAGLRTALLGASASSRTGSGRT